jgi:hypothetical protein
VAIWDRDCARAVDWVAAYNVWLLLWEVYRLKDLWHKLPGCYGGRRGNLPLLLELIMYGFWCRVWAYDELDARVGGICARHLELGAGPINSAIKPVIEAYFATRLAPDAGEILAAARAKANKRPYDAGPFHTEFWPYDTLAPELAYCRRLGLHVPAVRGVGEFPQPDRARVFEEVEEALVAVGCSRWG